MTDGDDVGDHPARRRLDRAKPPGLPLRMVATVVVLCLLLPGLLAWREWVAHGRQVREASVAAANLADALLQQAEATVGIADAALVGIVAQLAVADAGPAGLPRLNQLLALPSEWLPGVHGFALYDNTGHLVAGPAAEAEIAGKPLFQHHRDVSDPVAYVGNPMPDPSGGSRAFTVSRRVTRADGGFAGVAVAVIGADYFNRRYQAVDLGANGAVLLANTRGGVIARSPADTVVGDAADAPAFRLAQRNGSYRAAATPGGVERIVGYSRSGRYPLLVMNGVPVQQALGGWRGDAGVAGGIVLALVAAVGSLCWLWLRLLHRGRTVDAAVRESEARYQILTSSTTDVITCMNLSFQRTYVSPSCRLVYGYEPAEMLGSEPMRGMHPDDVEETYRRLRLLAAGAIEQTCATYRVRHKDGHTVWVEVNLGLVRDRSAGTPVSITASSRDISERKAQADELGLANCELERLARHLAVSRDEAERATRVKSAFLASMSHELRTPLHGILGYAELLRRETGLTPGQRGWVEAMHGAGTHLRQMINGVLDMSEIEAERVELQTAEVDLRSVADSCLDLVRPRALAKSLTLGLTQADGIPSPVTVDATRLRQILLNLLGNAVKFTDVGGIVLRLGLTGDGAGLRLEVADTGAGIPDDQSHRLFQDFERLDTEATHAAEGTGLGLSISGRLAALMGGRLSHAGNPGGGSVFTLELPLAGVAPADPPQPPILDAVPLRVLRVLVVDDAAMNREIAAAFLASAGHQVVCAAGGAEAVALAAASDFDVVLMDVRMPDVDGFEATRRLRALPGQRGQVPVVALTAQAFADQVDQCGRAGMNTHLAKPFTPEQLLDIVARVAVEASPSPLPSPPPPLAETAAGSAGFAVFDLDAFERTVAFLTPAAVAGYLQTLLARSESLRSKLLQPGALTADPPGLAAAAHTLSGSAGMFGFLRLASATRRFERALQVGAAEAPALGDSLVSVLLASASQMRDRIPADAAAALSEQPVYAPVT